MGSRCTDFLRTALHLAIAHSKDYNISRLLIERGADVNNKNIASGSPFHTFFNEVVSRLLLCHGKDLEVDIKDNRGRTPLHYIAWSSRSTIQDIRACLPDVALLIAEDDEGRTPLHFAARRGNSELANYFLTQGPHHLRNKVDNSGRSAFHYAIESKRTMILELFKNNGIDIYRKDREHRSVLHNAALINNVEAVKKIIVIAGEQELEARDIDGRTPLQLAKRYDAHTVVEYLLSVYGLTAEVPEAKTPELWHNNLQHTTFRVQKEIIRNALSGAKHILPILRVDLILLVTISYILFLFRASI